MRRLAIDPGRDSGFAMVVDGSLMHCGLADGTDVGGATWPRPAWLGECLIERPQVYPDGLGAHDPNDLITLALRAGEAAGYYRTLGFRIRYVLPREWKGQVPKTIHHKRIIAALTPAEVIRMNTGLALVPLAKRHNVLDAIGLAKASL